MDIEIVRGDLLDQPVEVIVNAWNRNIIPWWLLLPHGVSGAIKKRGGTQPFRELGRAPLPLGEARSTGAGTLGFKAIIHVAGINGWWCASPASIQNSVKNAMRLVDERGFSSVAFPVIGAGAGGMGEERALELLREAFEEIGSSARAVVVRFEK